MLYHLISCTSSVIRDRITVNRDASPLHLLPHQIQTLSDLCGEGQEENAGSIFQATKE